MTAGEARPAEFDGRIQEGKDWREIVAWVGDLPPMPHVSARAISLVENPQTTAPELAEVLSSDAALAARVLKIANSAMFSRQREITTLNQAIMIIGFKALKGVIVAATLRQINKKFGAVEQLIWENSMCTAMSASVVTKRLRKRYVEEIFLLGLLHSLGQIVLLCQKETSSDYQKVLKLIEDKHHDYVTAELEVFGFGHPLIGALVAKKWNFSAETCQTILHYTDALEGKGPEGELEEKIAIVQLADFLAHLAGVGNPPGYPDVTPRLKEVAIYLGFDAKTLDATLEEIVKATQEQFERERHVYG